MNDYTKCESNISIDKKSFILPLPFTSSITEFDIPFGNANLFRFNINFSLYSNVKLSTIPPTSSGLVIKTKNDEDIKLN